MARGVLVTASMKPHNPMQHGTGGPITGEGDKLAARRYNRGAREFIAEGKVDEAAHDAKVWVEREPEDASRAEDRARRGPHHGVRASVDELVAKGRSVVDRLRPLVERAADKVRSRIRNK